MESRDAPLVSILLAVHNGVPYVESAVRSVLRQTVRPLELVIVDDASTDETSALLSRIRDDRVSISRNEEQIGLAGSLNVALRHARGTYVARIDADDVAFADWLERLLARIRSDPQLAVVGSAMLDIDDAGRAGRLHVMPASPLAVRWHALFSAPFFHSTVVVDRSVLDRNGLTYDTTYGESEDYDLWTRLLKFGDGGNVDAALVLHRRHPAQASIRRGPLQRSHQRAIALREIRALTPDADAERAWAFAVDDDASDVARNAYSEVLAAFERRYGRDDAVRAAASRTLLRHGSVRAAPALLGYVAEKTRRRRDERAAGRRARTWLRELREARRVVVVSPEPTPYRAPLFDRIAARDDVELTVIYAARSVASRTWHVDLEHDTVFLRGVAVPGARAAIRHDYPVTPGIFRALREAQPDVVVVSGWSTFASQAAIAWCRTHATPYVLLVESHDIGPRPRWRRVVKGAVVPRLVRNASGWLAVGTLARDSLVARGADPDFVRVFANTIDVDTWIRRAQQLQRRRADDDIVVLSVGRAVPEKAFDVVERAAAAAGVRAEIVSGGVDEAALAQRYRDADVFALLSLHEPWGVVVNEAAASALPLVLSDRVGAARDLLIDGENGFLVPAGDADAAAHAFRTLASDPALRERMGARSRDLVRGWDYEPSVDAFVAAVRDATSR